MRNKVDWDVKLIDDAAGIIASAIEGDDKVTIYYISNESKSQRPKKLMTVDLKRFMNWASGCYYHDVSDEDEED